jgi:hypothetical protein
LFAVGGGRGREYGQKAEMGRSRRRTLEDDDSASFPSPSSIPFHPCMAFFSSNREMRPKPYRKLRKNGGRKHWRSQPK